MKQEYPECYLNPLLWEGDEVKNPVNGTVVKRQGQGLCSGWEDEDPLTLLEIMAAQKSASNVPGKCNAGPCPHRVPFGTKAATQKPNRREMRESASPIPPNSAGVAEGADAAALVNNPQAHRQASDPNRDMDINTLERVSPRKQAALGLGR